MSTTTDLLRELRGAGLSQTEIARRTGIPQPRLSRWEAGDTPTGADAALRLQALHAEVMQAKAEGRAEAVRPAIEVGVVPAAPASEHSSASPQRRASDRRDGPSNGKERRHG